ncbi:hypothetical protein NP233_g4627 [Leucocoprinus birnbaumii]|uniref:Cyclin-like domain-containing protein n=1 Tax=Leucocoprinus birnbaumii TaxID=56174 RepID=A0AAD5YX38_9AGAR|nr:hypothetical protein NP233_g4627 [Leucocoprinus birnbaumii]
MLLPPPLLLLSFLTLSAHAQTRIPLKLNDITASSSQTSFSIPVQAEGELTITIALCSPSSPRFFISNSTDSSTVEDPGPDGGENVNEIFLQDGFGNWTSPFFAGGVLAVEGLPPGASFEVGVSTDDPLHEIIPDFPLFGDSTNNQAIIFSPLLAAAPPLVNPTYPNYTFLPANPPLPSSSDVGSLPNITLILTRTTNSPLLRTSCFLNSSAISSTGTIVNSSLWLRDPKDGWRTEWLLGGLTPLTNYTAFVIQDEHKVSGPLYFVTKSASFVCTLVHALPFCPSTAYAVPLPVPSSPSTNFPIYDSSNVPEVLLNQTLDTMTNFTISLSTFACGSDMYSFLVGCDDCQREYRKWLCTTLFPRCSEPSQTNPAFITPNAGSMGIVNAGPNPTQAVMSALFPVPSQSSTPGSSSPYLQGYTRLLPCIEVCNAVDRACPPFLQFRCPTSNFNGAATYGFGYIDGPDGSQGGGVVKAEGGHSRAQSPANLPASTLKIYQPYFVPADLELLTNNTRGRLSHNQEDKNRQNAVGFLEIMGARIGFPRRTIATAQALYHRFHLFFPRKDFNYIDVCLGGLYVSTKMHDTLKKPRELLAMSYAVRFPDLAAKSKHPGGEIDLDTMDPQVVENDRQKLLSVERFILESICFNFTSRLPFPYVVKIGRALGATKSLTKFAWRIVMDCYRTFLPLQYPPHTIALGGLFVACFLTSFEQSNSDDPEKKVAEELTQQLKQKGEWEKRFFTQVADLEDITQTLLDLIIQFVQNPSLSTSPSTPSSPSPHLPHHSSHQHSHTNPAQPPYNYEQVIRMKIALRETEHPARRRPARLSWSNSKSWNVGYSYHPEEKKDSTISLLINLALEASFRESVAHDRAHERSPLHRTDVSILNESVKPVAYCGRAVRMRDGSCLGRVSASSFFGSTPKADMLCRVSTGAQLAFRTLIPPAEERIPLTMNNGIIPLLCYVPLVFMAYLARRPNTYPIRLLLLPSTICAVLYAAYHFTWTEPILNVYNWGQCLMAAVVIAKAFEYALTKEGMLKIGESQPGVVKGKTKADASSKSRKPVSNGYHPVQELDHQPIASEYIPLWLSDAFDLLHTNRGLSFKFGLNTYVPPFTRPLTSRRAFLIATSKSFIRNYCTLDFCESLIKLFPGGIGTPLGGSIFYHQLPAPFPRYLVSTFIHILTGFALLAGFGMVYDLCTLFAVGIIGTSPTAWPPVLEQPWLAESMHELWARRWHQLLRQTFLVYGAYPGKWAFEIVATIILAPLALVYPSAKRSGKIQRAVVQFGALGMLLGAFAASGLFHEWSNLNRRKGMEEGDREESGWVDWETLGVFRYVRHGSADDQFMASPWFGWWNGIATDAQSDTGLHDTIAPKIFVIYLG